MLKWMIDEEYSSGSIFSKIILTKFDKIKFQNLGIRQRCKNKSRWGRSIILEEIGFQYFSHTQRMFDEKFCLILRFESFLKFTKGPLQEKIIPPPHSTLPHRLPPPLASDCAMEARILTATSNARVTNRMMWRCFFIRPPFLPQAPVQRRSPVPGRVCILLLTASAFPCPAPNMVLKLALLGEQMRQKRLATHLQVPVPSYPRSW